MRSQILCVLLFIPWSVAEKKGPPVNNTSSVSNTSAVTMTTLEATQQATTNRNTSLLTTTQLTPLWSFLNMECRCQLIVCGGLIIACAFFLMTTLVLACKVCRLSRRITMLIHHDVELVNSSKYWVENSKSDKIKSKEEAKETTSLMGDQTNQEVVAGGTKEDGGKVNEDGKKTEENEEGGASTSEEASAEDAAETSSFPKPPDEILNPAAAASAASSSSEGVTAEPNNQPQNSE